MKLGDFKDISVNRLLHFVQSAGQLNKWIQGLHKGSEMVDVHGTLWCPPYFYCVLWLCMVLFYHIFTVKEKYIFKILANKMLRKKYLTWKRLITLPHFWRLMWVGEGNVYPVFR
jgi:hypothetical protein